MHGLIIRALQSFVCFTYGRERWIRTMQAVDADVVDFEAMLVYERDLALSVLSHLCTELERDRDELLEDLGTYLVSSPNTEALRRLMRFGGDSYLEFLHSLDDLPDRARLAVSDLWLPELELSEHTPASFTLACSSGLPGYAHVMVGLLRAMADDYGALVLLELRGNQMGVDRIAITLIESAFAQGRSFDLGARAV